VRTGDCLTSSEAAGCYLWDLSADAGCADFMVKNHAVEVLQAVLSRGASPRAEETACGIAANLLCHARLAGALEPGIPSLLSGVASVLEDSVSTAALTEACRAMAAAAQAAISGRFPGQWQHRLVGEGLLSRLVWMVDNSLDAALVANALELAGCAACMSELAVQRLLQHGLAAAAAAHLSGFCRAMVSDDGAAEPSASEAVADASLRVIEVIAAHDDGARAIEVSIRSYPGRHPCVPFTRLNRCWTPGEGLSGSSAPGFWLLPRPQPVRSGKGGQAKAWHLPAPPLCRAVLSQTPSTAVWIKPLQSFLAATA